MLRDVWVSHPAGSAAAAGIGVLVQLAAHNEAAPPTADPERRKSFRAAVLRAAGYEALGGGHGSERRGRFGSHIQNYTKNLNILGVSFFTILGTQDLSLFFQCNNASLVRPPLQNKFEKHSFIGVGPLLFFVFIILFLVTYLRSQFSH